LACSDEFFLSRDIGTASRSSDPEATQAQHHADPREESCCRRC